MASIFYDLPSDKVTGTWSSDGTLNSSYPFANIDDGKPWNPTKYTANPTGILLDMSTPKRVDFVSLIHCNFDVGAVIKIQMNATNSWASPTVSVTLTIAGPDSGDSMPANPFADLTTAPGYTTSGLRYLLVHVVSGQSSLLSLGEVRVSSHKRVLHDDSTSDRDRDYGAVDKEDHPTIKRLTDAGTQVGYSRGTRARWATGNLRLDATGYAEYLAWTRAARGTFKPFAFCPDPTVNEMWFAIMTDTPHQRTWTDYNVFDCPFAVEELGRGLAP